MISLDQLDIATPSDAGTEIELLHPVTGEPTGIYWSIVGKHSERYAAQKRILDKEDLERAQKHGKDRDKALADILNESNIKNRSVRQTAAACTGWRTVERVAEKQKNGPDKIVEKNETKTVNFNGVDHEFSVQKAEEILSSRKWSWVLDQVSTHVHNDSLFMKP